MDKQFQVRKEVSDMRPDQLMGHEEMRWSYMTDEQLARRLKRMTRPEKLDCFMDMANLEGKPYLHDLALERKIDLGLIFRAEKKVPNGGAKVKAEVKRKWEEEKEEEIDERFVNF